MIGGNSKSNGSGTTIHRRNNTNRFSVSNTHNNHHHNGRNQYNQQQQQALKLPKPKYLPLLGENDSEYMIDSHHFKLPKIKRNYVGRICTLVFNRYTTACDYLEPLTLREQAHSLVNMVNAGQIDCDGIVPPPEIHAMTSLAWSAVKVPPPTLGSSSTVTNGTESSKKKDKKKSNKSGKEKDKDGKKKSKKSPGPEAISEEDERDGGGKNEETDTETAKDKDGNKKPTTEEEKEKEKGDITSRQFEYMKQLKQLKEGYIIYCEVYMGMMYLYEKRLGYPLAKLTNNSNNSGQDSTNIGLRRPSHSQIAGSSKKHGGPGSSNAPLTRVGTSTSSLAPTPAGGTSTAVTTQSTSNGSSSVMKTLNTSPLNEIYPPTKCLPGGEKEICRILLSHMDLSTSFDPINELHYLHLELTSDEVDSPFNVEKYYNRFPSSQSNVHTKSRILSDDDASFPHRFFGSASDDPLDPNRNNKVTNFNGLPLTVAEKERERESNNKNTVSGNVIRDIHKLTFQFMSFSEMSSWKLFFQNHIDFSYDVLRKISNFTSQSGQSGPLQGAVMKFHNLLITSQPSGRSFNCQERQQPPVGSINFNNKALKRRKYHARLDRGYLGLFMDDVTVTPTWSTALEIIPLKYCHLEIKHKKIIRLRNKCLTRVILLTRDAKREFFVTSEFGETDPEILSLLQVWQDNIDYANSMIFRYLAPWMKDIDLLKSLGVPLPSTAAVVPSTASSTSGGGGNNTRNAMKSNLINAVSAAVNSNSENNNVVTCMSSGVRFQITVPEPSTSDDDSDLEDGEKMDEDWEVNQFRIVKPKPPVVPHSDANNQLMSGMSTKSTASNISGLTGTSASATSTVSNANTGAKGTSLSGGPTTGRQAMISGPSSLSSRGGSFANSNTTSSSTPATITPQPPSSASSNAGNSRGTMNSPRGRIGSVVSNNAPTPTTANNTAPTPATATTAITANSIAEESAKSTENNDETSSMKDSSQHLAALYDKVMFWKDTLTSRFEKFPPSLKNRYFHGHLLYIQESQLLVMMFELRVFMIFHLTKCIEVIPTKRSAVGSTSGGSSHVNGRLSPGTANGSPVLRKKNKTTMQSIVAQEKTNRLYNLDSSDEEEQEDPNNSDRDYENFDEEDDITAMAAGSVGQFSPTMNETSRTFMLILLGYDG
jgi:hypothetical protein